jgi:hypothetical protein
MKRLIAAAVIITLLILTTAFGGSLVAKTETEVTNKSDSIIKEPSDQKIKEFKEYWQKRAIPLSFFVNRESIEEIGRAAAKMTSAGENGDKEEILESAEEIKYIIGHIAEQEKFCLQLFF